MVSAIRLILVGCVAAKVKVPAKARDLYASQLFTARRTYAEASGLPWAIVSAQWPYILAPERWMQPYDKRLEQQTPDERRQWLFGAKIEAAMVFGRAVLPGAVVEVHAGARYADALRLALVEGWGLTIETPLRGLGIGRQLGWYKTRREGAGVGAPCDT